MSRLYQANISVNTAEQMKCLSDLYKSHGIIEKESSTEVKTRAGRLHWGGDKVEEKTLQSRKGSIVQNAGITKGMTTI